jgi:hypothetical protein
MSPNVPRSPYDVVEDNHRIETAKLHHGPLQKSPGALRQHACGLDSADQIDDPDFGTIEELIRNGARGSWRMSHNVNYPRRKPGLLCDFCEHDSC